MLVLRSDRPELKDHDGEEVTLANSPGEVTVQLQDGTLVRALRGEVIDTDVHYILSSQRHGLKPYSGQRVTRMRSIKPEEGGYSDTVPQSLVEADDGRRLTVFDNEIEPHPAADRVVSDDYDREYDDGDGYEHDTFADRVPNSPPALANFHKRVDAVDPNILH